MKDYFIYRNGLKQGPYSTQELIDLGLEKDTLLWKVELEDWTEAWQIPEIKELLENSPPPLSDLSNLIGDSENERQESEVSTESSWSSKKVQKETVYENHPWRRLLARTFDLITLGVLTSNLFTILYHFFFPVFTQNEILPVLDSGYLTGPYLYIHYILVEGLIIHFFGATPGKWLFGIKVKSRSEYVNPTLFQSYKRGLNLIGYGEGVGFPLFTIATRIYSYRELLKKGKSTWDEIAQTQVYYVKQTITRIILAIALFIVAILGLAFLINIYS